MHKRHLILWYRPGDGRPREFFVSPTMFGVLISAAIVVLAALVLGSLFYSKLTERALERDKLLEENRQLRGDVARVHRIEAQLKDLQRFSEQVKRSLTEGADLERILEAGEAVEEELPSGIEEAPWIHVSYQDTTKTTEPLDMMPASALVKGVQLPERWPVDGFITRGFESSPVDPSLSHAGLDLAVPRGTPVRAVAGGVVIAADWTPRYGYRVILDHGGAVLSMYGHNELLFVHPGDRVQAGSPIALSGNSGISTAPHLHFEMWVNGRAVDPRALLPKRGDDDGVKQAG